MKIASIQVYVSTYSKYSAGNLSGAWVDLEQFAGNEEGFLEFIAKLHNDEADPEFMIQDYEGLPGEFYSESGLDSRVFDWLSLDETNRQMVSAFLDCFGDSKDVFNAAESSFIGIYGSDEDFAYEMVASCYSLNEPLISYFDYEKFARDLMMDHSSSNGFYFSNNW